MADISKISPDNGTTIYNLKDIEARKRVPEVLLKDTVGWSGKNLLKYPYGNTTKTDNGIMFTDNGDGSISLSGTATAQAKFYFQLRDSSYIPPEGEYCISAEGLTSGISIIIEGYTSTAWVKNIATITSSSPSMNISIDYNGYDRVVAYLTISNGKAISSPITVYPMLRKADISDSTYEPYHASVEEVVGDMRAEQAVLGAKNLLVPPSASNSQAGGEWTVNSDGSISISGTPTGYSSIIFSHSRIENRKYILTGWENATNVRWASLKLYDSSYTKIYEMDIPTEVEQSEYALDLTSYTDVYSLVTEIKRAANNVPLTGTLYPMLRLASDPDDTYVPYAMTNRELTDMFTVTESIVTTSFTLDQNVNRLIKFGKVVQMDLLLSGVTVAAGDTIGTLPEGFRPAQYCVCPVRSSNGAAFIDVYNGGSVKAKNAISNENVQIHATWITS